jgi:hypothetical protein
MTDATAADWEIWLRPIAAAVRNTPGPNDVRGRAAALAFTMRGIPLSALTPDKARDLCRKSEFFPSVAEIEAVFAADWKEAARSRSITGGGLARLALPSPKAGPNWEDGVMPPAERQAAVKRAMDVASELRAGPSRARAEPAKPMPLTPHQLLAAHEAEAAKGNRAAAIRAEAIRRAMGADQ